jgi:hypothetical protein
MIPELLDVQSHRTGWNLQSAGFQQLKELVEEDKVIKAAQLEKSLTTGQGIVTQGTTGGEALRVQFLHDALEQVSFEQDDAALMKIIPKKKVPSNTVEWTDFLSYGSEGDAFVYETGSDGNFGVNGSDDNFSRQVAIVKYMATSRTVSIVSGLVNNIQQPMQVSEKGATLELIGKMNLQTYTADSTLSDNQFNGIRAQIKQWVLQNPNDSKILWDAQGQTLSRELLEDVTRDIRGLYGRPSLILCSIRAKADLQKLLFPNERFTAGTNPGYIGVDVDKFKGSNGTLKIVDDVMLRQNDPLVMDGVGVDGLPRSVSTTSANALSFAVTPFVSCAAGSPSTGNYYTNVNLNTDTSALGTAPALPTSGYGGNATNNLVAGNYWYAVSPVYQGKEGTVWVFGASSAGTVTGATEITGLTFGQVVKFVIDGSTPCITGLGSTISRKLVKFRVYRYGGPSAAAPTALNQFGYLCDLGCPTSGNPTGWDNGMYIPGTESAYVITESKGGSPGWFMAQLLPLMKRPLPHLPMADLFAMLAFVTPILWVPRHHAWIRNIGYSSTTYLY